jgi:hypothetical protein
MSQTRGAQRSEQRIPQRLIIRTGSNRFEFDRSLVPTGMHYEWKRATLYGQEDTENLVNLEQNGWVCVPPDRHPELSGRRATVNGEIRRGGLVLMERPDGDHRRSAGSGYVCGQKSGGDADPAAGAGRQARGGQGDQDILFTA